jgi:membrane fusion protein (multidrug efflux system)
MKLSSCLSSAWRLAPLVLIGLLTACAERGDAGAPGQRGEQGPLRVLVSAISEIPQRTRVEAVGTSRAVQSVTLYPEASGEVVAVNFAPGEQVEKGKVLLELESRDEALDVELAKVRVADAERLYERYQRSVKSGATLPIDLDAAEAALDEARIELRRAEVALDERSVEAPFAGYVGISDVEVGDRIQTSTAITTLDNREALLVDFQVPEMLVGNLKVGDQVAVATWNNRQPSAYGEVVELGSRVDPTTRTFTARALVENRDDQLRPGQSFRVALEVLGQSYPVLPEVAVQWGADGAYAWTLDDNRGQRVPVEIIQRQQGQILVDGPLQEGDLIVVEGIQRMRPGIEVDPELASPAGDVGANVEKNSRAGAG